MSNVKITNSTKDKKSKGEITGIGPGIVLIIGIIFLCVLVNSSTKDVSPVNEILNVSDFYKSAVETISKEDLIAKYGQPEKTENWDYKKADGTLIPLETLSYENNEYEYHFKDNQLVRITINKSIPFNSVKDVYKLFAMTKHDSTQENYGGTYLRIYNTSVPDFWCTINNKKLENIRITYKTGIFD